MMSLALLALIWFPHVGAGAEVSHDLGVDPDLRGQIRVEFIAEVLTSETLTLELNTEMKSYVRENHDNETLFRVSPQQVHYPVGATLRFQLDERHAWALVARHQSNHDVDTNDAVLNRETISFEVYGAQLLGDGYALEAGLYYDRGTRAGGRKQYWPFDYYLGGLRAQAEWPRVGSWYAHLDATVILHRNSATTPPHANLGGHLDAGWRFSGQRGQFRMFARGTRITDYQQLGDRPHHMIMLGVSVKSSSAAYRPGAGPISKY